MAWEADHLGVGFEAKTLALPNDDEGPVVCTLVRYRPEPAISHNPVAVLYLHGWSDYFFQKHLAEFWNSLGINFYALDLRKYGRSLMPGQTPGYITNLNEYDADLEAAFGAIRKDLANNPKIIINGHSTGGLVASLWTHFHPGEVSALALNSPWLELQGSALTRTVSMPAIATLARVNPKSILPNIDPGYYSRVIREGNLSQWEINPAWRPDQTTAVRPGWLQAILNGHAQVSRGLEIPCPVSVFTSSRTFISPIWNDQMRNSDVVLDVEVISRRALQLGPHVTVVRIKDGLHDLALSRPEPRRKYFDALRRWVQVYGW